MTMHRQGYRKRGKLRRRVLCRSLDSKTAGCEGTWIFNLEATNSFLDGKVPNHRVKFEEMTYRHLRLDWRSRRAPTFSSPPDNPLTLEQSIPFSICLRLP